MNGAALMQEVERWAAERSAAECQELLMAGGVPCSRYLAPEEILTNEDLRARGTFTELDDADGSFLVTNPPFRLRHARCDVAAGAPRLGEHTRDVLADVLGIVGDDFDRLVDEGAVGMKRPRRTPPATPPVRERAELALEGYLASPPLTPCSIRFDGTGPPITTEWRPQETTWRNAGSSRPNQRRTRSISSSVTARRSGTG